MKQNEQDKIKQKIGFYEDELRDLEEKKQIVEDKLDKLRQRLKDLKNMR